MSKAIIISVVVIVLILIGLGWLAFAPEEVTEEEMSDKNFSPPSLLSPLDGIEDIHEPAEKVVRAADIAGVDAAFQFASVMPAGWEAEAVVATQAVNLYDPSAGGEGNLEQSQIFIRFFRANDFLTLSTVDILNQEELVLNGRPARPGEARPQKGRLVVEYTIKKKASVANFVGQPGWRNNQHVVTDVRVSDTNPSVFYVIAKRPSLDMSTYQTFLNELEVVAGASSISRLVEPVAEFGQRITKKPFGIFVTPDNSPVQPERFTGYHTAVDVEYEDVLKDVEVRAMAHGEVVEARRADGYGGVVVIQHEIRGEAVQSLYGHLDPASLPRVGQNVRAEDRIGVLGEGGTAETDGQRKHLHFGILKGSDIDIRGYISNESELTAWYNPVDFLKK